MKYEQTQIIQSIDIGLIVLDRDLRVLGWNRWMELHSDVKAEDIQGESILIKYPRLGESKNMRQIKSVINFGNYAYFSQKLHHYLIPMRNRHQSAEQMPFMQQSCTANPLRDEQGAITGLFIAVHDVTEYVSYEQKLLAMTKLDPLTGLFNRIYLEARIADELERARRHGTRFSVVMIDIDHFKQINDTRGHLCGDKTLRRLAELLQQAVRTIDIVSRFGGEEFCCVLPETSAASAMALAERLRSGVENVDFSPGEKPLHITISLGIAEYAEETACLKTLIGAADAALYRAKREGRNRVVCSSHTATPITSLTPEA